MSLVLPGSVRREGSKLLESQEGLRKKAPTFEVRSCKGPILRALDAFQDAGAGPRFMLLDSGVCTSGSSSQFPTIQFS